ncbi:DUF1631 domain-containing protein [Alkalimarinus alittae]|uniref:DUF1631 domain-containing protein n=1 Tax=Alkalimarinus alittae TaxID=2961619 RepID=A0ABY6MZQ2_9ALTE|nr:DUF1631 domain-containing protein [Alkalimarinus alittae]UZE95252.1 DUF1631 domain-containing protein [Alkalimarinus alittae]
MNNQSGISYIKDHKMSGLAHTIHKDMKTIQTDAISSLMELLQSMFDGIDDSFFELANGARNNNEQNRFFEAMREIRIQRKGIENHFHLALSNFFKSPPRLKQFNTEDSLDEINADTLSLVQEDTLEEDVATNTMITKARANFQGQLLQIQTRMSSIYAPDSNEPLNPLDPEHICGAFTQACINLEINIREKLIVYKQFDRFVMSNLGDVYERTNKQLIDAGILPNLKHQSKKSRATARSSSSSSSPIDSGSHSENLENTANGIEIFSQIQSLLANVRQQTGSGFSAPANGNVQFIADNDLVSMLSTLQEQIPQQTLDDTTPTIINIRDALSALLEQKNKASGESSALNQVDEDLINLVSMLFEFILEDYNLSAPIQVLISRLQIPILKVVIKDKSFFAKNSHPARKLLNALAKAGIGWNDASEKQKDKLYEQIHNIVHTVLDEFNGDINIFETLYQQFSSFIEKEDHKAKIVEQRTKESEEGRIKSNKAQQTVEEIIKSKLASIDIPSTAKETIQNGWSRVMFLAYLKDDKEHRWQQTTDTLEQLIWCLKPHTEEKARQRWVRTVPSLLKEMKSGLQEVSYNSARLDQTMAEMKKALTDAFKQQSLSAAAKSEPENIHTPTAEAEPEATSIIEKTAIQKQKEIEEAAISEHLVKVDAIEAGNWIEFSLVNGSKFRCKLSTKIDDADCLIFVNRMGLKVVEKTRRELAHEMRRGRVKVLEQGLLVDRAMNSVMGNLRKMSGATA